MAFGTSFLTGMLQRQLDNWGQEDAAIATKIKTLGDKLVTADDNATQKVNKLQKVAGIMNSKYGKNGIYQLAYQVDNNSIDFNDDVDDIAKRVSEFQIPEDYIKSIANPYDYLGEASQSIYENDMSAINNLYTSLNTGNKTAELLIPSRDYTKSFNTLSDAPTIGAEPITSPLPGLDKSDYVSNAYNKLAYLVQNQIPIEDAMNSQLGEFALNEMEYNLIKGDNAQADSAEDILNNILQFAAKDYASVQFLEGEPRENIITGINQILGTTNSSRDNTNIYSNIDTSQMGQDTNVQSIVDLGYNVIGNVESLSDYQNNLPKVKLNMDTMSNQEVVDVLTSIEEGTKTMIEFISNGQTYFVEY